MDNTQAPIRLGVYKAITAVRLDLAACGVPKNGFNPNQKYNYQSKEGIYNAIAPLLGRHGLVIIPNYSDPVITERKTSSGGTQWHCFLSAKIVLASAEDGSYIDMTCFGEGMDSLDKAVNKAETAAFKYALIHLFTIPTESSDDPDFGPVDPKHTELTNRVQLVLDSLPEKTAVKWKGWITKAFGLPNECTIAQLNTILLELDKFKQKLNNSQPATEHQATAETDDPFADEGGC